ncbi:hypothetical protein EMCRGX_G011574 [Ephydatia muelleri]
MPSRSKQRVEYLQTQDNILSQENKAKARARYKADPEKKASVRDSYMADPEKKKASVRDSYMADLERRRPLYATATRPIPKEEGLFEASVRDSYKADPEKKKPSVCDSYKADPEKKKASVRDSYNPDIDLSNLLKSSDIKRTSRRTALLKGRNTRTIQLPLGHLKGIGIGMTPLSDWLNALLSAGVTELPLPPKVVLSPLCLSIEYWGVILNLMYKTFDTVLSFSQSYSFYEHKSHALMEYNCGLEKAILRDSGSK